MMGGEKCDLLLTDPPYGIGLNTDYDTTRVAANARRKQHRDESERRHAWPGKIHPAIIGDDKPFDPSHLLTFKKAMLWGANNYAEKLPSKYSWLVWDKQCERAAETGFSDCELCWCSGLSFNSVRMFRHMWRGYQRDSEVGQGSLHPSQKPVALMAWCLSFSEDGEPVADLYLGSGPTLIAAENLGRRCFGIEVSAAYCAVILQRFADAFPDQEIKQGD